VIRAAAARLDESRRTVAAVIANPNLRRLELGRFAATVSASGTAVLYVLLAYRAGGAEAIAALIVATTWTAAIASPVASIAADRFARRRVIVVADALRVGLLLTTALVAVDGPVLVVILLAGAVTVIGSASSSARAALVPELADDTTQLVGANAIAAMTASTASLLGPAVAGVSVAFSGPELALLVFAIASILSAIAALLIAEPRAPAIGQRTRARFGAQALGGFRALIESPGVRVVVFLTAAQTFVGGVLAVLLVLAAIETLDLGQTGPSYLAGALSAGTLLGSVALLLVGERRLAVGMAVGLGIWGLAAAAVGIAPAAFVGLVLIALIGLGDSLADLSALTIVQRLVPNEVLARALGGLRGLFYTLASLGSLLAPIVVDVVGVRAGLVLSGLVVPALALVLYPLLSDAAEAPAAPARDVLRGVPLFATLSPAALERLAAAATPASYDEGAVILREGSDDRGFYVVASGEVEIDIGGRVVTRERAGGYFGEIASLRDSVRSATVRATGPTELFVVPEDVFLGVLSTDEAVLGAAEQVVASRLSRAV
jgi:MFS family permease